MKVVNVTELEADRVVRCLKGGFVSNRILLEKDGAGFGLTKTVIPPNGKQFWHYQNHTESNYCVSGKAILTHATTGQTYDIVPGVTYIVGKSDPHYFEAIEETTLICTFNPPLKGPEVHNGNGSYDTEYRSPVYSVLSVPLDKVISNAYNPNKVAPPEMELLETSIWEDGYTQPVVTVYDTEKDQYVVVDGFHRYLILKNSNRIRDRERGMLPIVVLNKEMHDRMASTIRHNRARGSHNIELMSSIVAELVEIGKSDRWICKHIGMSPDELLRLKQITGVAALFTNRDFSDSWEAEHSDIVDDTPATFEEEDED